MNRFKKSKFLSSFFVLVVAMTILILSTSSSWFVSTTSNIISFVDRLVGSPFAFVADKKGEMSDLMSTYRENQQLKKNLYEVEEKAGKADSLEDENEQLRKLLEFKEADKNQVQIASEVIARTPASWKNELTIDKGTSDNVTDAMLVVANGGLVGSVSETNSQSSLVSLLTNEESSTKISVRIQTKSGPVYGIITGYDAKNSAYIISQLNSAEYIKEGDEVETSGLGAYNAENIPVGKVLSVSEAKDQLNKVVLVKPAADLSDIRAVMLVGN
ncbi:rod shape-determining protein MreC [Streptococcus sanguinis]|uniref:Cell shape-determining protein MreC n=1 Tax=Streptococcus sanguinis TaxID=1305 RepID=A0A0B7GRS6_STRSA|nr:rod shape-determining protein MreC [Streptococcus sanguinis]CEL91470.1 cell shape-determining protein MreC [Streptococcus sanguinis]